MAKYLVEVPHSADKLACLQAVQIFLKTGSHFLTQCDWGCMDGDHRAWFTAEADSKEEVLCIIPPAFRAQAKIVQLDKFSLQQIEAALSKFMPALSIAPEKTLVVAVISAFNNSGPSCLKVCTFKLPY